MFKKSYSLPVLNIIYSLLVFFITTFLIILWSYFNTQKVLNKNVEDYFNQSFNIAKIVLEEELKELKYLSYNISDMLRKNKTIEHSEVKKYLDDVYSNEELDLLYIKENIQIHDFSSSLFDIKSIIEEIDNNDLLYEDNILSLRINNENFLLLLYQKSIIDPQSGQVKYKLFIAKILNNNFDFVNKIKTKSQSQEVSIFLNKERISSTKYNINYNIEEFNQSSLLKKENQLLSKKIMTLSNRDSLSFVFLTNNTVFDELKINYLKYSYVLILIIVSLLLFLFFLGKRFVVKPINDLVIYTKALKDNKNVQYVSNVKEYNALAKDLKSIFLELNEIKEQYSIAIESVHDGLWDYEINKKMYLSEIFKRMLGYGLNDVFNEKISWFLAVHKDDRRKTLKKLVLHLKDQSSIFEAEYRIKCKNDRYKWLRVRGKAYFDDKAQFKRMTGFHTDINEIKSLQEENKKNEIMLYQQAKLASMGEMIANIAHQWRQPLSVISSISSSIQVQIDLKVFEEKTLYKNLGKINDTTQYLSEIINQFGTFFSSNKEKEKFLLKDTVLKDLVILESIFNKPGINLIITLDNVELYGFKVELMQVLINIISNAKDALIDKNIKNKFIFMRSYIEENNIFIEIYDNALGIAPSLKNKIYEPYFSTKSKQTGSGIGLYMSLQIINKQFLGKLSNNNYSFEYEGNTYKGEKFIIELPLLY
ncbi:MAG: hypothetical protein COA66_11460 [Arcobacter sp.]|nr:MAG: hypothetical protein COA66_11460 [Arcobacter sp.]